MSIMFSRTGHGNGRYSIGCQGCESTADASDGGWSYSESYKT